MSSPRWLRRNLAAIMAGLVALGAGFWLGWLRLAPVPTVDTGALWGATLVDLKGAPVALSEFKGKPVIVNFWATWCGPCKEEMPDFQKLAASELGKQVQIIGIGIDNQDNMRSFADKMRITYTLLDAGPQGLELLRQLGNRAGGLPYTVALNAGGRVVDVHLGRVTSPQLTAIAERALGM